VDSVKCAPDGCAISWRPGPTTYTSYSRSAPAVRGPGSAIVMCQNFEAKCDRVQVKCHIGGGPTCATLWTTESPSVGASRSTAVRRGLDDRGPGGPAARAWPNRLNGDRHGQWAIKREVARHSRGWGQPTAPRWAWIGRSTDPNQVHGKSTSVYHFPRLQPDHEHARFDAQARTAPAGEHGTADRPICMQCGS